MKTRKRLLGLKKWITDELCTGRDMMKAPSIDGEIGEIIRDTPRCYIGWFPTRPDETTLMPQEAKATCPSILMMPNPSLMRYTEDQHFDRYKNIERPRAFGQNLAVSFLFTVYEPGTRLPGFVQSAAEGTPDPKLILEATETGLFTLTDWMDDFREKLLNLKHIPGTDLFLNDQDERNVYSLYTESNFIVDKRPLFYGFCNVVFSCYADDGLPSRTAEDEIENCLK